VLFSSLSAVFSSILFESQVIPILLIVVVVLLLLRRRRGSDVPADATGMSARDPIRLILMAIVILLLVGVLVSLFAPLGNYRLWSV